MSAAGLVSSLDHAFPNRVEWERVSVATITQPVISHLY
jgi:hypothetical protein